MEINKRIKKRLTIIVAAIVLGIIFLLLYIVDINNAKDKSLSIYNDNQDILANVMMNSTIHQVNSDGSEFLDAIMIEINEEFPTSSSVFCIISKDDEIIFLKDSNTTSTLIDETISEFFDENQVSSRDGEKYIVSTSKSQYNGSEYTLTICSKQSYLIKKIKFDELMLHSLGYFTIYGILLIVVIILLFYKIRSMEHAKESSDQEIKNMRFVIEKLEKDKKSNYVNSEREGVYSFYNRSVVEEVISLMREEELKECVQITICIDNLRMEHFVLTTAILGRIKGGNSLACYWEENKFKVLLFHAGELETQRFIDLFISKYKTESEEKVEELKITASRLTEE